MKDVHDRYTIDFCARPVRSKFGRKKIYENSAARVAAYRVRKKKSSLTVLVDPDLLKRLDDFMLARDETKSEVVERALREFLENDDWGKI